MKPNLTTAARPRRGTTMLEIMVVMTVMLVAVSVFSQILTSTAQLRAVSRERGLAAEAARGILESLRNEPLDEVFNLYNRSPEDDPNGMGTSPGYVFDVTGLTAPEDSELGHVGEIVFPDTYLDLTALDLSDITDRPAVELESKLDLGEESLPDEFAMDGIWMLCENALVPELGMPRDLNGDNVIDGDDHRYDAIVIPVLVRVEWEGRYGRRELQVGTLLTDFNWGDDK